MLVLIPHPSPGRGGGSLRGGLGPEGEDALGPWWEVAKNRAGRRGHSRLGTKIWLQSPQTLWAVCVPAWSLSQGDLPVPCHPPPPAKLLILSSSTTWTMWVELEGLKLEVTAHVRSRVQPRVRLPPNSSFIPTWPGPGELCLPPGWRLPCCHCPAPPTVPTPSRLLREGPGAGLRPPTHAHGA